LCTQHLDSSHCLNVKSKALFISRFSPEVPSSEAEESLKEQLGLSLLIRTRLKTKFNTYVSFHISVTEDDFPPIYNTGVWPDGRCTYFGPHEHRKGLLGETYLRTIHCDENVHHCSTPSVQFNKNLETNIRGLKTKQIKLRVNGYFTFNLDMASVTVFLSNLHFHMFLRAYSAHREYKLS
jgi:hypothetical protein